MLLLWFILFASKIPANLDLPSLSLFKMSDPFKSAFTPNDGDNLDPILNLDDAVLRAETQNTITPRQRTEGLIPPRPIRTDDGPQDPTRPTPTDSEGGGDASEGADGLIPALTGGTNTGNSAAEGAAQILQIQADELDRLVKRRVLERMAVEEERRRQVDEEHAKKELISLVSVTVQETMKMERENRSERKPSRQHKESAEQDERTVTINGVVLRETPRTESEMAGGEVHISKEDRYNLPPKDKEKLKSTACDPMKPKFQPMDYTKLLKSDGAGADDDCDFGTQLLAKQVTMENFVKWAGTYDLKGIFEIFDLPADQYSDPRRVANAPKIDLLKHWKSIKPSQVYAYQKFLKEHLSRPDVESSKWVYEKLTASVEPKLLVQVKQTLSRRPEAEQGGISLFYLVAIAIDDNDYQNKQIITDYLKDYKLSDVAGEDVAIYTSRFKAAAQALRLQDVPSDLVETFLTNVRECKCEEFTEIARALNGSYHSVDQEDDNAARLELLEFLCGKLTTKYRGLLKAKKWLGAAKSCVQAGGFKAEVPETLVHRQDGLAQPNPAWQAWWDKCVCEICGDPHPTKYHNDLGARNRPYRPYNRTTLRPNRTSQNRTSQTSTKKSLPRDFKSPADEKKYKEVVHKAMIDYCLPCGDQGLSANVAATDDNKVEDEPEMYANVAGEAEGDDDHDDNDDYAQAQALAMMALDNLTNW